MYQPIHRELQRLPVCTKLLLMPCFFFFFSFGAPRNLVGRFDDTFYLKNEMATGVKPSNGARNEKLGWWIPRHILLKK